jgi:sugar lactone lactonase YvrE
MQRLNLLVVFFFSLAICNLFQPKPATLSADEPSVDSKITFAGTGKSTQQTQPYAEGQPHGPAATMPVGNPFGIEIQGQKVWITSVDDQCIYHGSINGTSLSRVAGNGLLGYSGDGGLATEASFNWPHEVRADESGNLFVADTRNHVIRRIDHATGIVTTIAGDGTEGFAGDGDKGDKVRFRQPHSVVLDGEGGLLVADTVNHRIRRIDLRTGIVRTICGTGEGRLPKDGQVAEGAPLFGPRSLAIDETSIWIALREGNSVWRIDRQTNRLQHVAGTGKKGYSQEGGPPKEALFKGPKGLVIDDQGRILLVDTENQAVREIDPLKKTVITVLGERSKAFPTTLKRPHGIAFSKEYGFMVGDSENHRVLLVK